MNGGRSDVVHFYSFGRRLRGLLSLPGASPSVPVPSVVLAPDWPGLGIPALDVLVRPRLTRAGFAVLTFHHRGVGESEGEPGRIRIDRQIEDIVSAVTYVRTREDLDGRRVGCLGLGGIGGGNAIIAAASDDRIRAVAAIGAIADGEAWLRSRRSESGWQAFLERVALDRRRRVLTGEADVAPLEDLIGPTPRPGDAGPRPVGDGIFLSSADELLRYRPLDVIHRISPRPVLLIRAEAEAGVPPEQVEALYARALQPKRIERWSADGTPARPGTRTELLLGEIEAWFARHLDPASAEREVWELAGSDPIP